MKAYVTSIGESTTDACIWSLERQGFETILVGNRDTSLWEKLKYIFENETEDFLRVDADTVCNQNINELITQTELLWYQGLTFDWFKQDVTHGGVQFVRKEAIPIVLQHIDEAANEERPETYLTRLPELYNPRTFGTFEKVCGLTGYKQEDKERVAATKRRRGTFGDYDWDLAYLLEQIK